MNLHFLLSQLLLFFFFFLHAHSSNFSMVGIGTKLGAKRILHGAQHFMSAVDLRAVVLFVGKGGGGTRKISEMVERRERGKGKEGGELLQAKLSANRNSARKNRVGGAPLRNRATVWQRVYKLWRKNILRCWN